MAYYSKVKTKEWLKPWNKAEGLAWANCLKKKKRLQEKSFQPWQSTLGYLNNMCLWNLAFIN